MVFLAGETALSVDTTSPRRDLLLATAGAWANL